MERSTGSVVGGSNSDDAEYDHWRFRGFTDGTYDYVFEGYLLFDYVATDAAGDVSQKLTVDSSFHVLSKTTQRSLGDLMTHDDFRFAITPPPPCSDGVDNDGDGKIDWDGGPGMVTPDPECTVADRNRETPSRSGGAASAPNWLSSCRR